MTRAFVINLTLPDGSDPSAVAEDIADSLASDGYSIVSVAPWASPSDTTSVMDPTPQDNNGFVQQLS